MKWLRQMSLQEIEDISYDWTTEQKYALLDQKIWDWTMCWLLMWGDIGKAYLSSCFPGPKTL